jgi:acetoin utilization deacetylase AcuC-like enzyme
MGRSPRSTLLFRHPAFSGHDTGDWHPENPSRILAIDQELERRGLLADRPDVIWEPATDEQILRVHSRSLLERLAHLTDRGGGPIDMDTIVFPDSLQAARVAAGAAVAAVDAVAAGEIGTAVVLGRPPGHHATAGRAMGFCLLNTIAIGAAHAVAAGFRRVAILDWDVHHGNGTQDIFAARDDVLFCSTHRYDGRFFPASGAADERGTGQGAGYTLNVPLRAGDGDAEILRAFDERILPAVESFQPDLVMISAGYDAHRDDPLGGLDVTDEGFRALASRVQETARESGARGVIAVLEGGYHPLTSARCVADTIDLLDGVSI